MDSADAVILSFGWSGNEDLLNRSIDLKANGEALIIDGKPFRVERVALDPWDGTRRFVFMTGMESQDADGKRDPLKEEGAEADT